MPYGSPFVHPYAPLWQDADTEELNDSFTLSVISLCHGHVINQSAHAPQNVSFGDINKARKRVLDSRAGKNITDAMYHCRRPLLRHKELIYQDTLQSGRRDRLDTKLISGSTIYLLVLECEIVDIVKLNKQTRSEHQHAATRRPLPLAEWNRGMDGSVLWIDVLWMIISPSVVGATLGHLHLDNNIGGTQ